MEKALVTKMILPFPPEPPESLSQFFTKRTKSSKTQASVGGEGELLTPMLVHTQPPAVHQNYHLSFPTSYGSHGFCSNQILLTLWTHLSPDFGMAV